ncbi:hypothetical protein [Pseudoalteromonas nigrifaciens]|uniref:hypothetical protein n=1 Tax=Pseudoalteromonas nigrifaciens TaxID=28109 RepID=UPI003FD4B182
MTDNSTSASPLAALQKSGTISSSQATNSNGHADNGMQKEIVNGVKTLTPIIAHLIRQGTHESPRAFTDLMDSIKKLQQQILIKATEFSYRILPKHYVAINRLAMHVICSNEYDQGQFTSEEITSWCVQLFYMDDIYADSMLGEHTDDEFALQFMAVSKLTSVIIKYIINVDFSGDHDDVLSEIMTATIETVDSHIDDIYEQFIAPNSSMYIRNHLITQSSEILAAILEVEKSNYSQSINASLINKKFDIAYRNYIAAITLRAETRG